MKLFLVIVLILLSGCVGHKLEYYDIGLAAEKGRDWETDRSQSNIGLKVNFHVGVKK